MLRYAPARMLHEGPLAAIVTVSVTLLAGLIAAGPLFASATAYGILIRGLDALPAVGPPTIRPVAEFTVDDPEPGSQKQVEDLVDRLPYLGARRTSTLVANSWHDEQDLDSCPFIRSAAAPKGSAKCPPSGRAPGAATALLYYRTGVVDRLQVVSGTRGAPGLWLPDAIAAVLKVGPGAKVEVGRSYPPPADPEQPKVSDASTTLTVAGVYRTRPDTHTPAGPALEHVPLPEDPAGSLSPANLLIGDLTTIGGAVDRIDEKTLLTVSGELSDAGRTPDHLRRAADAVAGLQEQVKNAGSTTFTLLRGNRPNTRVLSGLPAIQKQVDADAVKARQQGRAVAYAGAALGLAALLLALRALTQRRQRETELLVGRGTPVRVVVLASMLELLLPALIGGAAGLGLAYLAFSRTGPHAGVDAAALGTAAKYAATVVPVSLLGAAVVTLAQALGIWRRFSGLRGLSFGSQVSALLTGATLLAVLAILTRPRSASFQDPLAPLLPILVLACGCTLIVRTSALATGLLRSRRRQRDGGVVRPLPTGRRAVDRMVVRGLRDTGVAVADLVIVLSVGIGVLTYGLLAADTVGQSVDDKAAALAGANASASLHRSWLLGGGDGPAPDQPEGTTVVWRAIGSFSGTQQLRFDVLVVNPPALRQSADWGSGRELAAARTALSHLGNQSPDAPDRDASNFYPAALLVGGSADVSEHPALQIGPTSVQVAVQSRLSAFPGVTRPTIVLDSRSYFNRLRPDLDPSVHDRTDDYFDLQDSFQAWVWTRDSLPALETRMAEHDVPVEQTMTLTRARATPALLSGHWAAAYQATLGLIAAALAGLALVIAVDRRVAQAAPVDLLLKRFGFGASRLLRLRVREQAATCATALVVMLGPLAVMLALMPRLIEPAPELPPPMTALLAVRPFVVSIAIAAAITVLAAAVAAARSASLKPGEVLRDDA